LDTKLRLVRRNQKLPSLSRCESVSTVKNLSISPSVSPELQLLTTELEQLARVRPAALHLLRVYVAELLAESGSRHEPSDAAEIAARTHENRKPRPGWRGHRATRLALYLSALTWLEGASALGLL
jgi:hypothetical protein